MNALYSLSTILFFSDGSYAYSNPDGSKYYKSPDGFSSTRRRMVTRNTISRSSEGCPHARRMNVRFGVGGRGMEALILKDEGKK